MSKVSDYWEMVGNDFGAKTIWSHNNELNADAVGLPGTNLLLVYKQHWGSAGVIEFNLPDNPTWRDLFWAADNLIRRSGDEHHIFIEKFKKIGDGNYELITGS